LALEKAFLTCGDKKFKVLLNLCAAYSKLGSHKKAEKMVSNAVIELKTLISKANQSNKESSSSTKKLYKSLSIAFYNLAI